MRKTLRKTVRSKEHIERKNLCCPWAPPCTNGCGHGQRGCAHSWVLWTARGESLLRAGGTTPRTHGLTRGPTGWCENRPSEGHSKCMSPRKLKNQTHDVT